MLSLRRRFARQLVVVGFWPASLATGCGAKTELREPPCSFEAAQRAFERSCTAGSVCHGAAGDPLRLTRCSSYGALVSARSSELPSVQLVVPGHPERSFLYHKLLGDMYVSVPGCDEREANCGTRMPAVGGRALSAEDLEAVRCWIADGAPRADAPGACDAGDD
jgi:hypothetical protein